MCLKSAFFIKLSVNIRSWSESINELHKNNKNDFNSIYYQRLAYDEILSNLLALSKVRKRIKKIKKKKKNFN